MTDDHSVELSFTCPRCGMRSYNLHDVLEGYCGRCYAFTGVMPRDYAAERAHP